jgi:predicted chitinase
MDVATLVKAMPGLSTAKAQAYLGPMQAAMREFGITTRAIAAMWLAQVGHESVSLRFMEEIASGAAYEGRHDLGNTQPGDGKRFKGRGPIQITGRSNYTRAAAALGLPLVSNPAMAADPKYAFRVSAWWWKQAGLNSISSTNPGTAACCLAATRRINGGTNGLADRQSRYTRCWALGTAVLPAAGAGGGGSTSGGDDMTPSVFWNAKDSQLYRAVRGSDAKVYYMGPDTKGKWQSIYKNSHCASGVSITGNPNNGRLWISYVNTSGAICTLRRNPGAKNWEWSTQGGNVK